jgi:hypothetical protein
MTRRICLCTQIYPPQIGGVGVATQRLATTLAQVGYEGQLRKVKDIPLLVRAYANLPEGLRRNLMLAGYFVDSTEEEWTWTLVRELGLESQVQLTGEFPQLRVFDLLRSMHVYVQCSAFEGREQTSTSIPSVAAPAKMISIWVCWPPFCKAKSSVLFCLAIGVV